MNGFRDNNAVIDMPENDETCNYGLDKSLKDRAWVARLKKRIDKPDTISYVGGTASAANGNDNNNGNIWEPSIYRIPACMREVDPAAYKPATLSLGPYHQGKTRVRTMDEHKWFYFQRFLRRNPEKNLDDYLALVEALESQARGAYVELEPSVDSKEFVQMMLFDCCFLLEFLLKHDESKEQGGGGEEGEEKEIDPINKSAWAMPFVLRDMLLLENQLPFFLLERLLELNIPCQTPSLPQIILSMFWDLMPGKIRKASTDTNGAVGIPIHHILHLLYSRAIPTQVPKDRRKSPSPACLPRLFEMFTRGARIFPRQVSNNSPSGGSISRVDPDEPTLHWIPCAKKLREAGVMFKRKKDYKSFLEVSFDKGVMEIPPLQIFGYVDSVFRNLIAFEQCHIPNGSPLFISNYAYLMNLVVDTTADVQLLKQEGIIVSTLGNDEDIAILFNQLRKNTTIGIEPYLNSIFESVLLHCDKRMNRWKATLNHNYFNNPWAIISVVAAILLFVLTILAFFSYLRPTSAN